MNEVTSPVMSLEDAIKSRRSVRGYLNQSVPELLMSKIFKLAQHAPSNCNIQPWQVYVASGKAKNTIKDRMVERVMKGVPFCPDYEYPTKFDGEYYKRQVACAVELYKNMDIKRGDSAGRLRATLRNFEMFDAPHVCFIGMSREFGASVAIDVGMYVQNLMLAMTAHGVACCPQGTMRYYPDLVREAFDIPEQINILLGMSFGFEDTGVAANKTRVGRVAVEESVVFRE